MSLLNETFRKKESTLQVLQLYLDEKLEKYNTILLEQIDKKFYYLTNKDQYQQVQKEELAKLISKLNPSGNNLHNYQTLFKLNEFFDKYTDLASQIKNQFAEFLNINNK